MDFDKRSDGALRTGDRKSEPASGGAETARAEMACYIEDMLSSLESLAGQYEMERLRDLLRLAKGEARQEARKGIIER